MSLKAQLTSDMKSAMKAGDKERLKAIRLALAAVKQVEVDQRIELDDAGRSGGARFAIVDDRLRPNARAFGEPP